MTDRLQEFAMHNYRVSLLKGYKYDAYHDEDLFPNRISA